MIAIREATREDIALFEGVNTKHCVRALVAEDRGEVLAIAGTYLEPAGVIGFSEMKEGMRHQKKAIVRLSRVSITAIKKRGVQRLIAFANPKEPTAHTLLTHLGFKYLCPSVSGDVYLCLVGLKQAHK